MTTTSNSKSEKQEWIKYTNIVQDIFSSYHDSKLMETLVLSGIPFRVGGDSETPPGFDSLYIPKEYKSKVDDISKTLDGVLR